MRKIAALLAVLALAGVACGGTTPPVGGQTTPPGGTFTPPPSPSGKTVRVGDNFFDPKDITVAVGDLVTWDWGNGTREFHNVVTEADAPAPIRSGDPTNKAGTFPFTFTTRGTYKYVCQVHVSQGMVGTVTVTG